MEKIVNIIDEQKEQTQEDILCILEGNNICPTALDNICEVIVKRFNIVKDAVKN